MQIVANESAPQGLAQVIQGQVAGRNHRPSAADKCGNISTLIEQGKSRDIAARAAGLGCGKTLGTLRADGERSLNRLAGQKPHFLEAGRCWWRSP